MSATTAWMVCWVGVAGVDVCGGAVADALEDEGGTADEFDVAVGAGGLQASAEFMEEGPDLCGGEFSAGHAVARLRSRMKTFKAASSGGVSDEGEFLHGCSDAAVGLGRHPCRVEGLDSSRPGWRGLAEAVCGVVGDSGEGR